MSKPVAEWEASFKLLVGNVSASIECFTARAVIVGFFSSIFSSVFSWLYSFMLTSAGGGSQASSG